MPTGTMQLRSILDNTEDGHDDFLKALPHDYYDEDMLHGAILTEIKDFRNDNKKVTAGDLLFIWLWIVCILRFFLSHLLCSLCFRQIL